MRKVAIGLVLVLAACTSVTDGQGSAVPSPSQVTSSAPPSSPSVGPSTSPSVDLPTSGPGCAPGSIAPTGAPFCYPLPAGFTDFSSRTDYATDWTYRSLIGIGVSDLVEVLAVLGPTDTDTLSDAQLRAYFDRAGLIVKGKLGFTAVSPVVATRVDGARAFRQEGLYQSGVNAILVRAYSGRTVVFVSCQSKLQTLRVNTACAQVLTDLQIERR